MRLHGPVAKTFEAAFPKGEITKVDVDQEHGVTVYDLEFEDGGIAKQTDIAANGTMLEFTVVVDARAVPARAWTAIQRAAAGAVVKRIQKIEISHETKDGMVVKLSEPITHYAVEVAKGSQMREIVVTPDGTLANDAQ